MLHQSQGKARSFWLLIKIVPIIILVMLLGAACVTLATVEAAKADTITYSNLGYPWVNAACATPDPKTSMCDSDYPTDYDNWGYTTCPSNDMNCMTKVLNGYGVYDPWNYYLRNCTGFVAWKLWSLGVNPKYFAGLGNGGSWYTNAKNKRLVSVGTTPQVGAAAVAPSHNHVAYVSAVNADGSITVQEYNHDEKGDGDTWTGLPSSRGFTEYVYFASKMTNTAYHLHQFYVANGSWTSFDVSSATGVSIAGNPAIGSGGTWVRDTSNHLRQFYVASGSWTAFDATNATGVQVSGDPAISSGGVWVRDTNGDLRQFYVANGSWTSFDVSSATGVTIAGNPVVTSGGIYARDTNNHLRQFYVSNGSWMAFDVSAATGITVNGDPAISSGGVWVQDTNNHLRQLYISNGAWTAFDVSKATGVNIASNPVVDPNGGEWARDTNGHLRQFYVASGSWTSFDVSAATGVSINGDPATGNGGTWARDANNHMRQFYVANGAWTTFDATNATGVSISLDPVVDSSGLMWAAS